MSLIVKMMTANRGNDDHPRHPHIIIARVRHVKFIEPTADHGPQMLLAVDEDERLFDLKGNVYVMNEAGRTLSRFEVEPTSEAIRQHLMAQTRR